MASFAVVAGSALPKSGAEDAFQVFRTAVAIPFITVDKESVFEMF